MDKKIDDTLMSNLSLHYRDVTRHSVDVNKW